MVPETSILHTLAKVYRHSQVGRSGQSTSDFTCDYRKLLKLAHATDGEALVQAQADLHRAEQNSAGALRLDRDSRDDQLLLRVRLSRLSGEAWLFTHLQQTSPTQHRQRLASLFTQAAAFDIPAHWQLRWQTWCQQLSAAALVGQSITPFSKEENELPLNEELLTILPALLAWPGESLRRFASCVICGHSKRLGDLSSKLESALSQLHGHPITLEQIGLLENPRSILLYGPLQLTLPQGLLDLSLLSSPIRLGADDIRLATSITTTATCCLTVENDTTFYELAKLKTNTLLIQTSYPGRALITLFQRLLQDLPCWHFGDTDPAGFDILRDLRQSTNRPIQPLHMRFRDDENSPVLTAAERNLLQRLAADASMQDVVEELQAMLEANRKGRFEQESLGWPQPQWPFY
jgi:hypothetical protein